jgi:hypothetical protein
MTSINLPEFIVENKSTTHPFRCEACDKEFKSRKIAVQHTTTKRHIAYSQDEYPFKLSEEIRNYTSSNQTKYINKLKQTGKYQEYLQKKKERYHERKQSSPNIIFED